MLVVGDDQQTVLQKESVIDDYLFREFNLPEALDRASGTQMKGGGSNIFSLVKNIHEARVLLDEHYRCPPDIIAYSNRYVYDSQLKVMKWQPQAAAKTVYVNYSEDGKGSNKKGSGAYKGLDTDLIDRFLAYMEREILKIEKEVGRRISLEKDVAICYFLLKNTVYFDDVKSKFLSKMQRGQDILAGAGAALQGKERDYIFYLWDIQRSNIGAFKQGDDPERRKGELNVLMSRPKKRAYHYLHSEFKTLKHGHASITDYLWTTYTGKSTQESSAHSKRKREKVPSPEMPINRSSGPLVYRLIQNLKDYHPELREVPADRFLDSYSEKIGDPNMGVDLLLLPKKEAKQGALAMIDLSYYDSEEVQDLIDYYFQLKRVSPKVEPVFLYLHDLLERDGSLWRQIRNYLKINS